MQNMGAAAGELHQSHDIAHGVRLAFGGTRLREAAVGVADFSGMLRQFVRILRVADELAVERCDLTHRFFEPAIRQGAVLVHSAGGEEAFEAEYPCIP